MKKVREYINEKFSENSDPIQDMNIGGMDPKKYLKDLLDPVQSQFVDYLLTTIGHKIKGKFRVNEDINSKKYNIVTSKINGVYFLHIKGDDTLLIGINNIVIYFVDDEDNKYYYYFKDAEKFYIED
jgi:hypothetical protein